MDAVSWSEMEEYDSLWRLSRSEQLKEEDKEAINCSIKPCFQ